MGAQRVAVTLTKGITVAGTSSSAYLGSADDTLNFTISGTSTSRTVKFELTNVNSDVFTPCVAFNANDPTVYGTETTNGSDTAPENWSVGVPGGFKFRVTVSAVAGGSVVVAGTAVIQ